MVRGGISRDILGSDGIPVSQVARKAMKTQQLVDNFCRKGKAVAGLIQINHKI